MQPKQLGPFQITRILGRGGMGAVYEGVHSESGELAAVKVLLGSLEDNEEIRTRFEIEIDMLKRLRHPNIVRLFGFGEEDETLYYVMEMVNGPSLQQELRKKRHFEWYEVARIGLDLCSALKHAHDRGIIHRDIKPANILLSRDEKIKLSDFGIAQFFGGHRMTSLNAVVGTIEFMAPEQAISAPIGPKADLYSLGAVLYALICNKPPYTAKNLSEIIRKHETEKYEPIRSLRHDIPEELERLVENLLEIKPENRPINAYILGNRILKILRGFIGNPDLIIVRPMDELPFSKNGNQSSSESNSSGAVDLADPSVRTSGITPQKRYQGPQFGRAGLDENVFRTGILKSVDINESRSPFDEFSFGQDESHRYFQASEEPEQPKKFKPPEGDSDFVLGGEPLRKPGDDSDIGTRTMTMDAPEQTSRSDENESPVRKKRRADPYAGATMPREYTAPSSKYTRIEETDLGSVKEYSSEKPPIFSVRTFVLISMLLSIAVAFWYLLQPVTADDLYAKITSTVTSESDADYVRSIRSVESQIEEFLVRYPHDPRTKQIRFYEDELNLYELERRFERKIYRSVARLHPAEREYAAALGEVRSNPELAMRKFRAILDLYGDGVPKELDHSTIYDRERHFTTSAEQAVELARRRLILLQKEMDGIIESQLELLNARLETAEEFQKTDPERAKAIREAILELYSDRPWAVPIIERAQMDLAEQLMLE